MNKEMDDSEKRFLEDFLMDIEILDKVENNISGFNAFETLGLMHNETRHRNVLSWLLIPSENHGLGEYMTKKVVQTVIYNSSHFFDFTYNLLRISLMDYHDVIVSRERCLFPMTPSKFPFFNCSISAISSSPNLFKNSSDLLKFSFSNSISKYGTIKKYLALVWMVEVPGNNLSAKPSRIRPIPSSSTAPGSLSASSTAITFSRCSLE